MTIAMATSIRPEGCAEYFPWPCAKTGLRDSFKWKKTMENS